MMTLLTVLLMADLTASQARDLRTIANEIRRQNAIIAEIEQLEEQCYKLGYKRFRPSYSRTLHEEICQQASELRDQYPNMRNQRRQAR